jgi:hypothetical protein
LISRFSIGVPVTIHWDCPSRALQTFQRREPGIAQDIAFVCNKDTKDSRKALEMIMSSSSSLSSTLAREVNDWYVAKTIDWRTFDYPADRSRRGSATYYRPSKSHHFPSQHLRQVCDDFRSVYQSVHRAYHDTNSPSTLANSSQPHPSRHIGLMPKVRGRE